MMGRSVRLVDTATPSHGFEGARRRSQSWVSLGADRSGSAARCMDPLRGWDRARPGSACATVLRRQGHARARSTRTYPGRQRLGDKEFVISPDEQPSVQAWSRIRPAAWPVQAGRYPWNQYERRGTLAYLAAYDVRRARVIGRCDSTTGIARSQPGRTGHDQPAWPTLAAVTGVTLRRMEIRIILDRSGPPVGSLRVAGPGRAHGPEQGRRSAYRLARAVEGAVSGHGQARRRLASGP